MARDPSAESQGQAALLRGLSMYLASLSAVQDEEEITRLVATGMPSLVSCIVSGTALRHDGDRGWSLNLQLAGRPIPDGDAQSLLNELLPRLNHSLELERDRSGTVTERAVPGPIPRLLAQSGVRCLELEPILTVSGKYGALVVGCDRPQLGPEGRFVCQTMAAQLAVTIENIRLHRELHDYAEGLEAVVDERTGELRETEKRQRMLLHIARAVSGHLERERLFETIANTLAEIVSFDRMGILVARFVEERLELYAFDARGGASQTRTGRTWPLEGTVPAWVIEHKRPFIGSTLDDVKGFPVSEAFLREEGMNSNCLLPLVVGERAVGVLYFLARQPGSYDSADVSLLEEIAAIVAVALDKSRAYEEISRLKDQLARENLYLREELRTEHWFEEIVGDSRAIKKALKAVETVAPTDATVLITGETGTGKELFARAIHNLSPRQKKSMVKVNCAALPANLVESELFGHEKGAFTGAHTRKLGRFELADGGSIFLDEIGDLPLELQAKLLLVLQEGEFQRVGGSETLRVDVRVIAATNRNLEQALRQRTFREDLYYRLNVFPIPIVPLRERKKDIRPLVSHFCMKHGNRVGKKIETLPRGAIKLLESYDWPGNVRELENVIERGIILSEEPDLNLGDWLPRPRSLARDNRLPTLEELEREHIRKVLELTGWRVSGKGGAAELLGMKRTTLQARMAKLGINKRLDR